MNKSASNVVSLKKRKPGKRETDSTPALKEEFGLMTLADVQEEETDWIWETFLARGELTTIDGNPDVGKSFLAQQISKWVCDGETNPPNGCPIKQGKVLYFDFENSPAKSTKPRMKNLGCCNMSNFFLEEARFSIADDEAMAKVHRACERIQPDLVVFDTMNRYLEQGTEIRDSIQATKAMDEFLDVAKQHNCSVIILRHPNKNENAAGLYRAMGSISMMGVQRLGIAVAEYANDEFPFEEKHRGMISSKFNDGPKPPMMTYRIVEAGSGSKGPGKIRWGEHVENASLDDLYASTWARAERREKEQSDDERAPKRKSCKEWLLEFCEEPQRRANVLAAFLKRQEGGVATLEEAREALMRTNEFCTFPAKREPGERGRGEYMWFACDPRELERTAAMIEANRSWSEDQLIEAAGRRSIDPAYVKSALYLRKKRPHSSLRGDKQ